MIDYLTKLIHAGKRHKIRSLPHLGIWLWLLLCIPCLLASCGNDDDEKEKGLSVSLSWANEADKGTEVKDVKLWIFNADKDSLVEEKHYGSAEEMASQRFQLPEAPKIDISQEVLQKLGY